MELLAAALSYHNSNSAFAAVVSETASTNIEEPLHVNCYLNVK